MAPIKSYAGYLVLVISILVVSAGFSMLITSNLYSSIVVDVEEFSKKGFSNVEIDSVLLCSYDKIEIECKELPVAIMVSSIFQNYNQSRVIVPIKPICMKALKQQEEYLKQRGAKKPSEPILLGYVQIFCGSNATPKRVVIVKSSSLEDRLGLALITGGVLGAFGSWLVLKTPTRNTSREL